MSKQIEACIREKRTVFVKSPDSQHEKGIYFWQNRNSEGVAMMYSNVLTRFTPHWCDVHTWAYAVACQACAHKKKEEMVP